jgi:hypothetical protein
MTPARTRIGWLMGRGVTAGCGLTWEVPPAVYGELSSGSLTRREIVTRIQRELRSRQEQVVRDGQLETSILEYFANAIRPDRNDRFRHGFVTTNWNTVIDLVLQRHGQTVWHLNGSIDGPVEAFLTEADTPEQRNGRLENHPGFRWLLESEVCVLAGISLRSAFDREIVHLLGSCPPAQDARSWCVVNESHEDLSRTQTLLRQYADPARIMLVHSSFQDWVRAGLPEWRTISV